MRIILAALLLTACSGGQPQPTSAWEIGPTIDGKQYSTGSVNGNVITVQDVHYVTRSTGPLTGSVSVSFTLSAKLTGTGCTTPATASLYFQRAADDWTTDGNRWWAATTILDHAGAYSLTAPLDGAWTSVNGTPVSSIPDKFAGAKLRAERVGFTLGNCTGFGHGATGPATLTINSFAIG